MSYLFNLLVKWYDELVDINLFFYVEDSFYDYGDIVV